MSNRAKPSSDTPATNPRAGRMPPAARKEQLLKCAIKVFANKGIGEAVHADVAAYAEVSTPTTFHYFRTRNDLVFAVLDEIHRFLIEEIVVTHYSPDLDGAASIEDILMTFCDAIQTKPEYIQVWLEWSVSITREIWPRYLKFYRSAIKGVKIVLKRGIEDGSVKPQIDLDDCARVIVGLAHTVAQMKYSKCSRKTIQHTIHSLVSGYLADPSMTS